MTIKIVWCIKGNPYIRDFLDTRKIEKQDKLLSRNPLFLKIWEGDPRYVRNKEEYDTGIMPSAYTKLTVLVEGPSLLAE